MRWVVLALAFWGLLAAPVLAQERRVALVIGQSQYRTVEPLANPAQDARLVSEALARAGFEVRLGLDLDKAALETALDDFANDAQQADVAAVYFAGHGFEAQGRNWLVPIDAAIAGPSDIPRTSVPFEAIAKSLAGAKVKIVALDACRNNPFAARAAEGGVINRGLAEVELDGYVVLYAAAVGQVALDGSGGNSPFAQAFARRISESGVDLRLFAGRVRDDVAATTGGQQKPFISASLSGDVTMLTRAPAGSVRGAAATRARPSAYFEFVRQVRDPKCFQTSTVKCQTKWFTLTSDAKLLTTTDDGKARLWDATGSALQRTIAEPEGTRGFYYAKTLNELLFYGSFHSEKARSYNVELVSLSSGARRSGAQIGQDYTEEGPLDVMRNPNAAAFRLGDRTCPFVLLDLTSLETIAKPDNLFFQGMNCDWVMFDEYSARILGQFNWSGGNAAALKSANDNKDICAVDEGTDAAFNGAGGFHVARAGDIIAYDGRCRALRTDRLHEAEVEAVYHFDKTRMMSRSVDGVIKIWSAANGKVERTLSGLSRKAKIAGFGARPGAVLILDEARRLYVWSGEPRLGAYVGPSSAVCSGELSSDANTLYALKCDGVLEVWRRRAT